MWNDVSKYGIFLLQTVFILIYTAFLVLYNFRRGFTALRLIHTEIQPAIHIRIGAVRNIKGNFRFRIRFVSV